MLQAQNLSLEKTDLSAHLLKFSLVIRMSPDLLLNDKIFFQKVSGPSLKNPGQWRTYCHRKVYLLLLKD